MSSMVNSLSSTDKHSIACPYFAKCAAFKSSLNIDGGYFDSRFDKCFCPDCTVSRKEAINDYFQRGEPAKRYAVPYGWVRFGLLVQAGIVEQENVFEQWHVSFHGTTKHVLPSIIRHQTLLLPGDRLPDGSCISIRPGHIPSECFFFTSPSARYVEKDMYATASSFGQDTVKVALQIRQQPNTYTVQAETIGWKESRGAEPIDPGFSNAELEWKSNRRGTMVLTGLLVYLPKATRISREILPAMVRRNIVVLGLPGKGKSTFLNALCDGCPTSERFATGHSSTAVTTAVKSHECCLHSTNFPICVFDLPGILDGKITLQAWQNMLQNSLASVPIHYVFLVVSAHDRVDATNVMVAVGAPFFLKNFSWGNVACIMTHCDQVDVTEQYGDDWLRTLEDSGHLQPGSIKQAIPFAKDSPLSTINIIKDMLQKRVEIMTYMPADMMKLVTRLAEVVDDDALMAIKARYGCVPGRASAVCPGCNIS